MKALRLTLAALLCSVPLLAAAQWQWVDKDGRKVFSDQAPPADVPANRILKQPGGRAAAAAAAGAPATAEASVPVATGAPPVALKPSGKDNDLEARKKLADAAEAQKRKAEELRIATARADNCERSRRAKVAFDTGLRVARTNAAGEREFLDDKQREFEAKRLDAIIARDCM